MDLVQELQRQGWYLSENGIKECSKKETATADEITREAINLDLKQIGEKHLPDSLGKAKTEFVDGPFILQIQKVRNVAVPRESEHPDGGHKLMRLSLTDGQGTCTAIDMNGISGLGNNTPPGSKIKLLGRVPVSQGFLLLNNSNCKLLGGRVEKLVESWELKKALTMQNRASLTHEAGGPPPFIPFGQRRKDAGPVLNRRDNFRSLDTMNKKKESDCEFEQQRKATIEAALQEGRTKTFGAASAKQIQVNDKNVATIVDMGFSIEQATTALRKTSGHLQDAINILLGEGEKTQHHPTDSRNSGSHHSSRPLPLPLLHSSDRPERPGGRRKGGKSDDVEDYSDQHTKPSAPATLFDFVTTKISTKSDKAASKNQNASEHGGTSNGKPPQRPANDSSAQDKNRQQSPVANEQSVAEKVQKQPSEDSSGMEKEDKGQSAVLGQVNSYGASSYHNPVQNLPPRLQKKHQREEEEKAYKFYGKESSAMSDWTRDRQSNKVYDVNSRGPVSNKNLWQDDKDERNREKYDQQEKRSTQKGRTREGKKGENSGSDKIYQGSSGDSAACSLQYVEGNRSSQTMHIVHDIQPLMECTPCSVPPPSLMQCTTDGVQLIQSMSALHLCPMAPVQVGPAFVQGHSTAPSAVICDGSSSQLSKDSSRWREGDLCMAKWHDKKFYRAKIIRTEPNSVTVNFIDYGDMEKLSYMDLMPLMSSAETSIMFQPSIQANAGGIIFPTAGVDPSAGMIYPPHNGHFNPSPVVSGGVTIVQGPANFSGYPTADQQYRIFTNSGRAGGNNKSRRQGEKQLYVPPAQRK